MPHIAIAAPVGAALITGAGQIAGGILGSGANKRATQAQERANNQALAFEREKYSGEQAERAAMRAEQQRRLDSWTAARNAILQKHGINVPGAQGGQPTLGSPGRQLVPMPGAVPAGGKPGGFTGAPPAAPPPLMQQPAGMAPAPGMGDIGIGGGLEDPEAGPDVLDWRNYGVR